MTLLSLWLTLALAPGCGPGNPASLGPDDDGDGFPASEDCDDSDPDVHPGAVEVCDGMDQDCDDDIDEYTGELWYGDGDGDGFGTPDSVTVACDPPSGFVADATDCDDTDPAVNPDGVDDDCDGVDQDCDGEIDEAAPVVYADGDGDGFGDLDVTASVCDAPADYVSDATDCDDGDGSVYPGAEETCDDVDEDCDGTPDNDPIDPYTVYYDTDGDGFGETEDTYVGCTPPDGTVSRPDDCNDDDPDVNPDAAEICNDIDDDCEGTIDEGAVDAVVRYTDADEDNFGLTGTGEAVCGTPAFTSDVDGDCDDGDSDIFPGATEVCDGADNDCDGGVDVAATDASVFAFLDGDLDGFGDGDAVGLCALEAGYAMDEGDCDDTDSDAFPGAAEVCDDTIDQDCDGFDIGCVAATSMTVTSVAVSSVRGSNGGDALGTAAAWLADVDGDLSAEVVVGAPDADAGAGAAYLLPAVAGTGSVDTFAPLVVNGAGTDALGAAVARVADWTGDGADDWAVGAPGFDDGKGAVGAVYVFSGTDVGALSGADATAAVTGTGVGQLTGAALAGGVDLDGDGAEDLVVGAPGHGGTGEGAVFVHFGPLAGSTSLASAAASFDGIAAGSMVGEAVAVGDLDGDGLGDLVLGAPGDGGTGAVYVFHGVPGGAVSVDTAQVVIVGDVGDDLGAAVTIADDIDGDGLAEVVAGAPGADLVDVDAGAVYVVQGATARDEAAFTAAWHVAAGEVAGDLAGSSIASGDVDGDGVPEIFVGASAHGGSDGATYTLAPLGGVVSLSWARSVVTQAVAADAGDVDGDGIDELFGTAPGRASGWVYVVLGSSL